VSFTKSQAKPAVVPVVVPNAVHAFKEWLVVVHQVVLPLLQVSQIDRLILLPTILGADNS
jgi:hypothetical protein